MKKIKSSTKPNYKNNENDSSCEQQKCKCSPILYVLIIIVSLFSLYLFFKVRNLEQKLASGAATNQGQNAPSPLSVDNLKKYAKEVGANQGKFDKCLDNSEKKSAVNADLAYGASVGIQGTPGFFINGRLLAGAFPFEFFKEIIDKELEGKGSDLCTDYSEKMQVYCNDPKTQAFFPAAKKLEVGNAPYEGASNPKVIIVEFSDFQCPYCIRAYPTVKQILETYKNDVRLYFKQFPLTNIHPFAQKAAEASLCVLDQDMDKFWKFHDKVFTLENNGS